MVRSAPLSNMMIAALAGAFLAGDIRGADELRSTASVTRLDMTGDNATLLTELKEGIVVLPGRSADADALAVAYRAALAQGTKPVVTSEQPWAIVAAGPLLDSPDTARIVATRLKDHSFTIDVSYTNVRKQGAGFRRNRPWRPIVGVSVQSPLPPGDYTAEVVWHMAVSPSTSAAAQPEQRFGPVPFTLR